MDYQHKYIKYKNKYNQLKNILYGKGLKINDIIINDNKTIFLTYDIKNNKLSAIRDKDLVDKNIVLTFENKSIDTDICNYSLINSSESFIHRIFNIGLSEENILKVKKDTSIVELSNDYKLFYIKYNNNNIEYEFIFMCNINNLESDFYYKNKDNTKYNFILNIIDNNPNASIINYIIKGKCQIRKSIRKDIQTGKFLTEILFDINKINDYDCDIKDIIDLPSLLISQFNFQISYDKLKIQENYCPESTILFKHIYNTYLTNKMIENYDFYKFLQDNFGNLLEQILFNNIRNNKDNISDICKTDKKNNILQNVMKRINTIYDKGILIKNGSGNFIDIKTLSKNYDVIFDTGNSAITTISNDLVKELGLTPKKGFEFHTFGVAGESAKITHNTYVILELKFDPQNTNINIDKTFKIKAYIDNVPNTNRILLGQSLEGLKLFFDNSYCIGYNDDKQIYIQKYNEFNQAYNIQYKIFKKIYDKIIKKDDTLISDLYELQRTNKDLDFSGIYLIYDMNNIDIDKEEELYNLIKNIITLIPSFSEPFERFSSRSIDNNMFIEKLKKLMN